MALALKLTRGTKTRRSAVPLVENTAATAAATAYREAHIAMDNAKTAKDMESVRAAYYDAARALCEAVR